MENNFSSNLPPLRGSSINRGIGVSSSSKPMSVHKGFDYHEQPFSTSNINNPPLVGSAIKPKSTSNLLPFYSSNVHTNSSPYDKQRHNPYVSAVYGQNKRYDISPLAPSNINNTRPLKTIFPSPYF